MDQTSYALIRAEIIHPGSPRGTPDFFMLPALETVNFPVSPIPSNPANPAAGSYLD